MMNHYQFFCIHLPSIIVTARSFDLAETIAAEIYIETIKRFSLLTWKKPIVEGYYVGRTAFASQSARFSQPAAKAA